MERFPSFNPRVKSVNKLNNQIKMNLASIKDLQYWLYGRQQKAAERLSRLRGMLILLSYGMHGVVWDQGFQSYLEQVISIPITH